MPRSARAHRPTRSKAKRHGETNRQRTREYHTGSKAWGLIRRDVLLRDSYTCAECGRYGNEVDHIDGDSTHNPPDGSNWQTLCKRHHSAKTRREQDAGAHSSPPR